MFYLIGLGLDIENISLEAIEICKKANKVYLETYTVEFPYKIELLEEFIGARIIPLTRIIIEQEKFVEEARKKEIVLLVYGSPLIATTHISLILKCKKEDIDYKLIHNSSIFDAVSETGLQVYKFGKTTSIPLNNEKIESPYDVLKANLSLGLHTLFLLDLEPSKDKFLSINDAINYLLRVESKRKENVFAKSTLCVGCARIGSENSKIRAGIAESLLNYDFGEPPYCLVVPGNLHFMESDALRIYYDYIKPS